MFEPLVVVFYDGRAYSFVRSSRHSASHFGGPFEQKLSGVPHGPKPLHLMALLGDSQIPGVVLELPLVYGMCYDDCDLRYRINSGSRVEILELKPAQSLEGWPYPNFPLVLPYVPLRPGTDSRRMSYQEFAAAFPNMPREQPAELVATIPPPATLGVSLWGRANGHDVTIVFECDLTDGVVTAYSRTR